MPLGGSPLNVHVDEQGQLQALRADRAVDSGIFYPAASVTGDAGLFIARLDDPEVFGFPVTSDPAAPEGHAGAHPRQAVRLQAEAAAQGRRKYAGKKLRATITVTAKDSSGNVKRKKTRRTIKVRPLSRRR